ncbi:hypothetical protein MSG28_005509 [Choristoneura fumiferana]|uniref:Uncharacterized protein n=1 Tax=Choristoneura fumiferana TaxID=7141 RepID=A0ACC0KZA8_CHOFU|nr:hypothetical protein MSG28_005509 [Choristoneura fumiferana]
MAKQKDMYRDTWVRYLGYANEVGEAFRPVVPARVVAYSYAIAFGISAFTGLGVKKFGRVLPSFVGKGITVAVALCCIPIIVSPIDHMVTFAMNHTYRMWYKP